MATGTFGEQVLPPPPPVAEGREHARVIQRQLGRTSLHVRLVDLASGVAVWLIGLVLFFLLAALIDHTLGLGTLGRAVGLALLVVASVYYGVAVLGPLLWKSINPAYAARTIEDATPSLKNSLINFLLLRQDRAGVKELVFEALERRAASDIAAVPVEATVDRSRLIRAGYLLCGVMAIFAAYKILSPKDPFQTAARVALPWADIARPSRVTISEVQPGHAEVYHGQTVTISAAIEGVREEDAVALHFSTEDGQTVDRIVEMKPVAGGRYECTLPPPDDALVATAGGLQQDVTYRLTAGDAETSAYELRVVAAPTIVVDRLEYQYPAYTKKPAETVAQQGDIRALEGTRVTIRAIANQPIKSAWIEFDPETKGGVPETVPLAAEGTRAWGTITLQLKDDRRAPWHAAYQVRFYNERQQRSQQPILHRIEVIRDLQPEVQILQPERLKIEVPENGQQTIEVRGVDPDFGLSRLAIEGTAGQKTVKVDLLDPDKANVPQAVVAHAFRPREHELVAGDELVYVAVAEDNRTDPLTSEPAANVARTTEYTLVILPPQPGQEGQGGQQGQAGQQDQPPMNGQDQPQQGQNQQGQNHQDPQARSANENTQARSASEGQEPMPGENQQGQGEQQGQQQQGGKGAQGQNQQGEQQGQQQGETQASPDGSGGSQSPSSASSENMGEGAQSGSSGGASQRGAPQQGSPMGDNPDPAATGQGNTSGQPSASGQQPSGQQGEESGDASGQPSGTSGQRGKAHDGEAIEQVLKELQQKGQSPEQGGSSQTPTRSVSEGNQQGDASADEGSQSQPMPNQASQGQDGNQDQSSGRQPGSEQGNPPQSAGKSGTQGQNTPSTGTPAGNDQKPDPAGQGQKSAKGQGDKGAKSEKGEKGEGPDRLPEEQQGQNPSEQPAGENEGGAPQGASKTDKGQKSDKSKGEERDAGAGQNGDEGAGSASEDKSGSGQGQRENRDRNKEQKPDSSRPEKGEVSGVSNSKKQSDSKGGASGDESGGGKQGAGQSAGQEGNDSAGSKSAADQGAGKASETGSGETGSKAGNQDQASGQTGQSGQDKGTGSSSRGDKGDKSGQGEPGEAGDAPRDPSEGATDKTGKKGRGAGPVVGGGADGEREKIDYGPQTEAQPGDAANLEYARKATEMALRHLRDQEHRPDPELLDKLGWSREDLAEFLRRWEALERSAETPEGQRELDEALKSLGLRDPANRKRAGGTASDDQRGLRDGGNRTAPPPKYRDLFDAFRKGAARSAQ